MRASHVVFRTCLSASSLLICSTLLCGGPSSGHTTVGLEIKEELLGEKSAESPAGDKEEDTISTDGYQTGWPVRSMTPAPLPRCKHSWPAACSISRMKCTKTRPAKMRRLWFWMDKRPSCTTPFSKEALSSRATAPLPSWRGAAKDSSA